MSWRRFPIAVTGIATLLLAGCAVVGPDFEPPEAPLAEDWLPSESDLAAEDSRVSRAAETNAAWWQLFDDPVLDHLIALAYGQNLTLRTAGLRIYEARAQLGIAVGDQYPQSQGVGAAYQRQLISDQIGVIRDIDRVIDIDRSFDVYRAGFDAAWELDFWGKFRRGIESADANLIGQIASYDNVLVTLTGDVASTYVTIRTLEERLAIARQNVATEEESLRLTKIRYKDGVTTELDVEEATALLNSTKSLIPELQNALRQSKNALSVLLGMPPSDLRDILGPPGKIPKPPIEVAIGVPAELLRRRPDIRGAELQAAAQSAQIGVAQADLYPAFTLAGSIGFEASDIGDLFTGGAFTGVFNPSITLPVFNYGRIKNNVRVQDARLQELIVNYQNTVLNAYLEVENALVGFLQTQKQADYLAKSVAASERAVKIALIQYKAGTAAYTRVLNTQTAQLRGQDRLTATRGQTATNLVALYKALGGGWRIRQGSDFIPDATKEVMAERTDWGDLLKPAALPEGDAALTPPPSPEPVTLFVRRPVW